MIDRNDGHIILFGSERTVVGILIDDTEPENLEMCAFFLITGTESFIGLWIKIMMQHNENFVPSCLPVIFYA